jgi:hypothetical protein
MGTLHVMTPGQLRWRRRMYNREMHENVFAIFTADETIALGVVKPLHCSLFCH